MQNLSLQCLGWRYLTYLCDILTGKYQQNLYFIFGNNLQSLNFSGIQYLYLPILGKKNPATRAG